MSQISQCRNRRAFLVASTCGFAGIQFGKPAAITGEERQLVAAESAGGRRGGQAKSVILFFLCGGASHVDTWDMKTAAPAEYRGPFKPIATSATDIQCCEHMPLLAKQAHHLAVIRSVCGTVNTNDHHAGYYYNLTGHVPDSSFKTLGNDRRPYTDDWPFIGSVVGSRSGNRKGLAGAITLPHKPSKLPYTRPGQFAGRLGVEFDPLYLQGSVEQPLKFQIPSLVLSGDVTAEQMRSRQQLLQRIDAARRKFDYSHSQRTWKQHQQRSLDL
ncbi:MAG: DUF1501 domain-containing protein, partial [Planctomycetales bacterium]|nr:DUF1501 domain-containing protein [Planctomycetales bacterium]